MLSEQIKWKLVPPVWIKIVYFNPTKRKSDLSNFCSIHDKFVCDALVELGVLEDDNYDFIKEVHYQYWWYDKNAGRVEIEIYSLNK